VLRSFAFDSETPHIVSLGILRHDQGLCPLKAIYTAQLLVIFLKRGLAKPSKTIHNHNLEQNILVERRVIWLFSLMGKHI
jgi:hypothetical protein